MSLYSSVQAPQTLIQGNSNTNFTMLNNHNIGNPPSLQGNQAGNEYCGYQTRNPPNQSYMSQIAYLNKANPQSSNKKIYPPYNGNSKKA